jgi:hypothetical protein
VILGEMSTASTVLLALAAGAIGSIVTAVLALGGRIARIRREIDANDRAIRNIDEHLERWVADSTIDLIRTLRRIRGELSGRGAFHSGEYAHLIGLAKEEALHWYRDQETTALSQAADIRAREGALHGLVRAWKFSGDFELRAPQAVKPVLDRWAAPATQHLSESDEPQPLESDPRTRTIKSTVEYLDEHPDALT